MDRRRVALDCLEVERLGYSVLDFLQEQGAISPWGTWWRLQVEELGRARYQIRDGKENKMAKKNVLTPQVRAEAESMIEAGEDPKEIQRYLAEHGSKNPSAHIYAIRNSMKKKAEPKLDSGHPEIKKKDQLAGFVPMVPEKKTVEFQGKEFERMEKPSPTCCQPAKPSGVTVPDQLPEEKTSFKIKEAEGVSGVWRNDGNGWISYKKGDERTKMRVEDWMIMLTEFPNVLKLFGIEEAGA